MGQPAARVGDLHVCPMVTPGVPPVPHVGGPILPPGMPTVLIGGMPAATLGNMCVCVGPPDVIIKGSLTVLIGGRPAARLGDSTAHGGVITIGFPTVLIGDVGAGGGGGAASLSIFGPGPLSEADAQLLFNFLAAQQDIAFAYPIDGCYARAHIMTQRMTQLGVTPKGKAWTFAKPGDGLLHAKTDNDPRGYVEWSYHVAPVIQVRNEHGQVEDRVMDPSLFDHPVSSAEWATVQKPVGSNGLPTLIQTKPGEPPVPEWGGDGYAPGPTPIEGADAHAARMMENYKIEERTSRGSYKGNH